MKVRTARLIDYKTLYNEKSHELISLSDLADPAIKAKHEKDLDNLYYLKYKLDPESLTPGLKPHLETDIAFDK